MLKRLRSRNDDNSLVDAVAKRHDYIGARDAKVNELLRSLDDVGGDLKSDVLNKLCANADVPLNNCVGQMVDALKEVVHFASAKSHTRGFESIRSTLLSAVCAPDIPLKRIAETFAIYRNRNYHKLDLYQKRREAFLGGSAVNMCGERYTSAFYGFPREVETFLRA